MKKLFAALVASLPLIYLAGILVCAYISPEDEALFAFLGGMLLLSLVCNVTFCAVTAKADRKFLASVNVWSAATNLALLIAELVYLAARFIEVRIAEQNGAMEGGLGIALLIVLYMPHWISYLLTRIFAAVNCVRALKCVYGEGKRIFLAVLHLFPLPDIFSAIWVYARVKKFTEANP